MNFAPSPPNEDYFWWYRAAYEGLYDADTIYVRIDLGYGINHYGRMGTGVPVRLWGIDAPELRGPEREAGLAAKAFAEALLPPVGHPLVLRSIKDRSGKYGRYLVEVLIPQPDGSWVNLNKELVANGHAEIPDYV